MQTDIGKKEDDLQVKKALLNKEVNNADLIERNKFETTTKVSMEKAGMAIDKTTDLIEDGAQAIIQKGASAATEEDAKMRQGVMEDTGETTQKMREASIAVKQKLDTDASSVHALQSDLFLHAYPTETDKVAATAAKADNLYNGIQKVKKQVVTAAQMEATDSSLELQKMLPSEPVYDRLLKTHEDEQGDRMEAAKKTAEDQLATLIDNFERTTVKSYAQSADKIYADNGHVTDKAKETRTKLLRAYDNFLTKVHVLAARIKGFSADQDEWHEKLQAQIGDEAALAQREMLAASNSEVETQALIDAKFRAIRDVANEDVKGVKGPVQTMVKGYVEKAKKETYKIMQAQGLSQEEKMERLKMVDQWMADRMAGVKDLSHQMDGELLNAEEEMHIFDAEAEKRMSGLTELLNNHDAASEIQTDRQQLEGTEMQLDQLAHHSENEVKQMTTEVTQRLDDEEGRHTQSASQVDRQLKADRALLEQVLNNTVEDVEQSLEASKDTLVHHEDMVSQSKLKVADIKTEASGLEKAVQDKVGGIRTEVKSILDTASSDRRGFERRIAELMRTLTIFMMQPLLHSKAFFDHQNAKHTEFAGRYTTLMEGDGMKLLHAVGRADKDLDIVHQKEKDALKWAQDWDATSDEWEAQVVEGLVKVAKRQGKDVDDLASSVSGFKDDADAAAKAAADHAADEIAKTMKAEDDAQAASDEAQAAAMKQMQLAQGATAGAADAEVQRALQEQENHAAHEDLATRQLKGETEDLLGQMTSTGQRAAEAAKAETTLTEEAKAQAAEAKAQMSMKLKALAAGSFVQEASPFALVQEAEGLTQQVQRVNAELRAGRSGHKEVERVSEAVLAEHDHLAAQHALLTSKISTLEKAAQQRHLLG